MVLVKTALARELFQLFNYRGVKARIAWLRGTHTIASILVKQVMKKKRLGKAVSMVERISRELKDLDYMFFKLVKPIVYVSSDIDILVNRNHIAQVVSKLKNLGSNIVVHEPYCIIMSLCGVIINVYVNSTIGEIIYLDEKVFSSIRE
ncbi:hypothetical protein J4526_03835 [Desulfurococcaceae archaeon MEX13E-LK6-19]|nr:hypothetical protein J4526_03835 [Desulfurococcaceae archaeon MEX13E-LK6-19]